METRLSYGPYARPTDNRSLAGRAAAAAGASSFDMASPAVMIGVVFALLFGLGAADAYLIDERTRLRSSLLFYRGLSLTPLLYLFFSYTCFVIGYSLKPTAALIRQLRPKAREWVPARVTVVTTLSFIVTFAVLVQYIIQVGYGRLEGAGDDTLANLSILGELSLIPYAFSLLRDARLRSGEPGPVMSEWDRIFLWGVMFPAQVIVSIAIGTRSRVATVIIMALVAQHYGARPLRPRVFVAVGAFLLLFVVPTLGTLRLGEGQRTAWDSLAGRTSAVETFTVIYENLDRTPAPDPAYWALVMGIVPRFLWPDKPHSEASERLTFWAVGLERESWVGATLPGELVMLFGPAGGLAFMALLGIIWRALKEIARIGEKTAWTALYLVALPTLLSVEVGFVIPYSVLTRYVIVTTLLLLASTAPSSLRSVQRSGMLAASA